MFNRKEQELNELLVKIKTGFNPSSPQVRNQAFILIKELELLVKVSAFNRLSNLDTVGIVKELIKTDNPTAENISVRIEFDDVSRVTEKRVIGTDSVVGLTYGKNDTALDLDEEDEDDDY